MPKKGNKNLVSKITFAIVAFILMAPIVIYIYTFGFQISSNHQRWGEMGSAMSGIYTPILASLTLIVLAAQISLQSEMNKLAHNQAHIQDARNDIETFIFEISKRFSTEENNDPAISHHIIDTFAYLNIADLQQSNYKDFAQEMAFKYPTIASSWLAFHSILAGLSGVEDYSYQANFYSAKQKAITTLSYEGCRALDNFVTCLYNDQIIIKTRF